MKVKIGDVIYDSQNQPIMIILSEEDVINISETNGTTIKYCSYPSIQNNFKKIKEWMKTD